MEQKKRSLVYIHGGQAYTKYDAYLEHLRTMPIDDPREEASERPVRWTDTLEIELAESFSVIRPQMPNKHNAHYEEWKIWFERHFDFLEKEVVLLGWSQGGFFLAKYLSEETVPFTIKALFLVAAPAKTDDFEGEDGGDFAFDSKQLPKLAKQVGQIAILHSKDDPVVPYEHAQMYKEALPEAKLHSFDNRGHFLIEEFPELIELIRAQAETSGE